MQHTVSSRDSLINGLEVLREPSPTRLSFGLENTVANRLILSNPAEIGQKKPPNFFHAKKLKTLQTKPL